MEKLIRYTLYVDGEKITSHLAEQFAGTSLQKAQQMLLKETFHYTDKSKSCTEKRNLVRTFFTKVFKFLFKFEKFLLVKFLSGDKASALPQIICLYVERDVERATDEPLYVTKSHFREMINKTIDNVGSDIETGAQVAN